MQSDVLSYHFLTCATDGYVNYLKRLALLAKLSREICLIFFLPSAQIFSLAFSIPQQIGYFEILHSAFTIQMEIKHKFYFSNGN